MQVKLIEIKQDDPGYNPFFGSWTCRDDITFIVDVGPAGSAQRLVDALHSTGIERLDYIFITHIHIDHCGALADILEQFPMAKAICHASGVKHMVEPENLWQGSLKVLGDIAEMYGPPRPVVKEKLIPHTAVDIKGLTIIETPGHAAHHLSFCYRDQLFAGEAGGNYFLINGEDYLRPATPPRFFFDIFMNSVDKLLALDDQPIHYAHFNKAESSHKLLNRFKKQLFLWKDILACEFQKGGDDFINRSIEALLEKDSNLKVFYKMDAGAQRRERIFLGNAIKGFLGYFRETV
ncbi:MAG TPA: MBL fold metallo-hydrolase [Desulfobacteraceae bacterium]|nr:MBL fold metallo-hydrolase [Desulfobacteraceae bacterium]